jgi:hypothetical protein
MFSGQTQRAQGSVRDTQVSMFGQLSGAGMESPIDACVGNLATLRDEGFRGRRSTVTERLARTREVLRRLDE